MKAPFPMRRLALIAALGASLVLAACGDNPSEAPEPPVADDTVPASAGSTSRAFVTYTGSLPADDRGKPKRLDGFVAPSSETELPMPVL